MKKSNIALFFICVIAVLVAFGAKSNFQLFKLSTGVVKLIVAFVVILLVLYVCRKTSGKFQIKGVVGLLIFLLFMFWLLNFS